MQLQIYILNQSTGSKKISELKFVSLRVRKKNAPFIQTNSGSEKYCTFRRLTEEKMSFPGVESCAGVCARSDLLVRVPFTWQFDGFHRNSALARCKKLTLSSQSQRKAPRPVRITQQTQVLDSSTATATQPRTENTAHLTTSQTKCRSLQGTVHNGLLLTHTMSAQLHDKTNLFKPHPQCP